MEDLVLLKKAGVTHGVTQGCLYKRSKSRFWWYKYVDETGKKRYVSLKTTHKRIALKAVARIQHNVNLARKGPIEPLKKSLDNFFETRKNMANLRTLKCQLGKYIDNVNNYDDLSKASILEFLDSLAVQTQKNGSPKFAPSTLRSYLSSISAFCRYLQKRDILPDNPCSGLRSELPQPVKTPPRFLNDREYDITLRLARRAGIYLPVFTALKTGMRMSEMRRMEWGHVQWRKDDKSLIIIPKDKSSRGRTIPLHPDLAMVLEPLRKKNGPVFKGQKGGFVGDKQWQDLLAPIQKWVPKFKRSGHSGVGTGWHLFRHTFGYRMAAAGTPIPVLKEIMGHSDISTTMIYARVSPDVWYDEINNA